MEHTKGKPINTSVPSIAIRFNANAEEIEELYQSEDEPAEKANNEKTKCAAAGDPESSPLRYLPRLGKRSTSIDTSLTAQDSSPPSDPWKFLAGIKGKITKSVEDTITEIKQRNQDSEGSAKKGKLAKDSSLSDSEDISESSISKTCGVVSTTEGVEMSSDDETPSLEKDKKSDEKPQTSASAPAESSLRQRFRIIRKKKPVKETNMAIKTLADLYEINTGLKASTSEDKHLDSEENLEDIESGVEAVEDINFQHSHSPPWTSGTDSDITSTTSDMKVSHRASTDEDIISSVVEQIDNLEVDEDGKIINIQQVSGCEVRRSFLADDKSHTFLAPDGFVDLRAYETEFSWYNIIYTFRHFLALSVALLFYFWISLPLYISGFIAGSLFSLAASIVYQKFCSLNTSATGLTDKPFAMPVYNSQTILEIPAVKEYQPVTKFEGWMNEYPEIYNPQTYHISLTQSVYVRLQGNLLRLSHTRSKIPKRATWNEPKHKLTFSQHRIYNLLGAKISLLPEGLNKRRHWSKKYPICITLNKDQLNFDYLAQLEQDLADADEDKKTKQNENEGEKKRHRFLRKKKINVQLWQFSLLFHLITQYSIILLLAIHWVGCMLYGIPYAIQYFMEKHDPNSWIEQSKINKYPTLWQKYVRCIFRACCYLFNINFGGYQPYTDEDIFLGITTFIIGNLFQTLLFVLILQILLSVLSAETKYQEIINQVQEYMGCKQLPLSMQKRLLSYYEYRFQKSYFRENAITAMLSVRIRREVNVYCCRRLVDSVSIFKDMPHYVIVEIVNSLKAEIFLPNDIIVKAGTIGDCMYFLASGTVAVVTPTGKEPQIFSKLTEEEEDFDMDSGSSRPSSPSPPEEVSLDASEDKLNENEAEDDEILKDAFDHDEDRADEDILSLEDWSTFTPEVDMDSPNETHLYLFGRTDREKEDWFRRFVTATHKGARTVTKEGFSISSDSQVSPSDVISDTLISGARSETEYLKYMAKFQKFFKKKKDIGSAIYDETEVNVLWINALMGRVLFDCIRDDLFVSKVKDRIQRKLSSIKLPYFIEQISISELSLGSSPPLIHKASKPILDQRGLWVDLDVTYEGTTVLTLQTKLNLMKLKQPPMADSSMEENPQAKWQNSDIDDTAESSSEEESHFFPTTGKVLDEGGNPVAGLGGTNTTGKKFIKMVDKIAESKFFQAATENRYIKKAMEGVSNTDLSLKVELKGLVGTLVLNIPPPPTDRIWIGFRPTPQLWLSAHPIVGERNMSFFKQLTNWIEKKLLQEFQKILVIPNMEDILIPVMSPKLPE